MIDRMEREIRRRPERTELALSAADVKRIRDAGKIAVVHAVEGGHVLEGKVENLDILAKRGVAMLTLCHFYANGLASQTIGIPSDYFITKIFKFHFGAYSKPALSDFGRAVLKRMGELSMLVDITHCTAEAREAIYGEINAKRPVVASHIGVSKLNPDTYNLADDEVREIARSGGGIGIIFMNYWLDKSHPKKGLNALWQTLEHIHKVTNSWDHIMIGTDFDGFTHPPADLADSSQMGAFTKMLLEHGLDETAILKILGGNAQRILEKGWR
jgi:membrane dipeptidase